MARKKGGAEAVEWDWPGIRMEPPPTMQRLLVLSSGHLAGDAFRLFDGPCVILRGAGALLVKTPDGEPPEGVPACLAAAFTHAALRRCSHILFEDGGPVAVGLPLR